MARAYRTRPGVLPSIQINVLNVLPRERYLLALERIKAAIEAGRELRAFSDEPSCSWGLCHESAETWPDAQDHIFPVDFERKGRMSQLDPKRADKCPMDNRTKADLSGCFHYCAIFKAKRGAPPMTKEVALARYDAAIQLAKERLAK